MSTAGTLALFARLLVSLGVVIGLMWFGARAVRRRGFGGLGASRGPGVHIDVLARRTLGRNASIAVVRAGEQALIIGITDQQVTKLRRRPQHDRSLGRGGPVDGRTAGPRWPEPDMEGDARATAGPYRPSLSVTRAVRPS